MLPQILTVNPMAKRRHHRHRVRNPFRHHHHRRHRNPVEAATSKLSDAIVPAAIGGAGAVGLDILLAYLPLPATLQSGWGNYAAKIAGSFALGWGAGKIGSPRTGHIVTAGALTVTLYTILRSVAQQAVGTQVKGLSGLADFRAYRMPMNGMGAYMQRPSHANYPGTVVRPGYLPRGAGRGAMMPSARGTAATPSAASPVAVKQGQMSAYMQQRMGGLRGYR